MVTQVIEREAGEATVAGTSSAADGGRERADLPPGVAAALAGIFSALGEPSRLRIVNALAQSELCVGDLAAGLGMAVPAVSQHLRILREQRIVRNRRAGKMVFYALDDAHVANLFAVAVEHARGAQPL